MNIVELYKQTPVARHQEITVSGDRLFFDGEEYVIDGSGELKLVRSVKGLEQALTQIQTKLDIK
jgi:hypothetical protein